MKRNLLLTCAVFGLAALLVPSPAAAGPIVTSNVVLRGDGLFEYTYDLTNPTDGTEQLFDFGIFFEGLTQEVVNPGGWDSIVGLGFIDWFSPLPALPDDPSTDIFPGSTLRGFSFVSALGPGPISFVLVGQDLLIGEVGAPVTGTTTGPSPVPEPATLWLIGTGVGSLVMRRRRSQRQS